MQIECNLIYTHLLHGCTFSKSSYIWQTQWQWNLPLYKTLLNVLVIILSSAFGISPICTITDIPTIPWDLCCASDILWYNSLLKPYNWICETGDKKQKQNIISKGFQFIHFWIVRYLLVLDNWKWILCVWGVSNGQKLQELLIEKLSVDEVWRNPMEYKVYLHKSTDVFGFNVVVVTEKSNCGEHTAGTQLRRLAFIDLCIGILVSSHRTALRRTKMAKDHLMEIPVLNATQHTQNCQIFTMDKLFQECPWAVQFSNIETVNIFEMPWIVPMCPGTNERK